MADYAIHDTTLYDIADVIRKKEGSSALIDPADYAGRVNLMGMLEEKTVSGSIVAFADGADAVKLKSCAVTIAPTLDGVSSVDVVQGGKNFIDFASNVTTGTSVGMTFSVTADGGISYSGTATGTFGYATAEFDFAIKSGRTFTFSRNTAFNYIHRIRLVFSDDTTANVSIPANATSVTYTPEKDIKAVRLLLAGLTADTYYNDTVYVQTEYGSTATAYAPYVQPTTHTASLGRTIYGGEVDVVNGEGTENAGKAVFTGSETWRLYSDETFWYTTLTADNIKVLQNCTTSNGVVVRYQSTNGQLRVYLSANVGVVDTQTDMNALLSNGVSFAYPYETPEDFTFTAVPIISRLGDNTLWSDGDLSVVYRSSGTQTLIPPTLISKTITANGTYTASDEDADGYDTVTVNVSGGGGGNTPQATQTLICDNSALGSSLTFTDDYENYDLIKFVVYRSDIENQFTFYMTPAMINAMGQYSSNRINFNQPYGNNFVCYTKTSNTAWTRYGVRNLAVKYVYGLTFTNCTVTETELYNRQGIGSSNVTFTPPTGESFLDYDYILLATCTGNSDETQVNLEIFQPDIEKDIFGSDNADENAVRVYKYNHGGTFVTVTENTITAFSYFYACGLKLSYNQQNLLSGFNSNSEQGEQENEIENEINELEQEESET